MEQKKARGSFTGGLGFVLAAAGSAVGLGNLWRFPYLAAKDGGGIFLLVYIILALTFGFALMTSEIAIGRKTGLSPIKAFGVMDKRFAWLGPISIIVPLIIFAYYSVIGGWVCKYALTFAMGKGAETVADGYFGGFITAQWAPIIWFAVFMAISAVFVFLGVDKGIEKCSKVLMPALLIIIIAIAVYSLTLSDPKSGRTAMQGLMIYITPDFSAIKSFGQFCRIVLDAMGQIFFSMSLAMGIMITYGSYSKKETNLVSSVNQIEICDTAVALIAGLIMIPVVYCFQGRDGLSAAGPSLMFVSLPQVFKAMGFAGNIVGTFFFLLVIFAALTSSVSIMEAVVAMVMDQFNWKRKKAGTVVLVVAAIIGLVTCLGYNVWYFELTLPNGATAQILDILDYFTNNLLMPIIALLTCVLVGWFAGTKSVTDEIKLGGHKFGREGLYVVMTKYVAPIFLLILLLQAFGVFGK